ncbi:GntR family transcriptional regulator [Heyndrickxia ginsengihumi]|uniref:GntR family transcriptional regulator n=1 Tax=Heyndrickxia ginsengihumi TaxID=363870 RepID=A0A0A6VFQ5_9BACI|nr:GntR family transcriptional regulator [Heyndrickxia ginsengihumi]KHD86406.1 GntR family transcriptional regulator [Heyndrickxia ginsengihumi]MBE6183395.1 GntR family transcriptional regulator [Bacillus sp. (in: firmicutes)]NEY19147.1 GntR family transcriptional regulator [Heyndrickxia ginsengihumi]
MIDKESPIPIYFQIQEYIRKMVESGEWEVGDAIPSERILSEQFSVSRMTIRQAVQGLVDEGLLTRKRGSGTFISSQKVEQPLEGRTSFTKLMEDRGMKPSSEIIAFQQRKAEGTEIKALKLSEDALVLLIERIRYGDDIPIALEKIVTPWEISKDITKEELNQSFYQFLERKKGLKLGNGTQSIEAVAADERVAQLLKINNGSPVLSIERVTTLASGVPFEYVHSQYAGSRFKFYI